MKDTVRIILIAAVILLPWVILLINRHSKNRQIIKSYKSLMEKYNLQVDFTDKRGFKSHPKATGVYRNKSISIISSVNSEGKKKYHYTLIKVICEQPYELQFTVAAKNKSNKLRFQNNSISLGDSEFDNNFLVITNNLETMKKIFNFNSKFKLQQALSLGFSGEIKFDGRIFEYKEKDLIDSETDLMRTELILHELCDLADELKHA